MSVSRVLLYCIAPAGGFYSKVVSSNPGVRAVVPNTNLYNKDNGLVEEMGDDPGGQLKWMEEEMEEAKEQGQKVR